MSEQFSDFGRENHGWSRGFATNCFFPSFVMRIKHAFGGSAEGALDRPLVCEVYGWWETTTIMKVPGLAAARPDAVGSNSAVGR
jgi:hypothetical protein